MQSLEDVIVNDPFPDNLMTSRAEALSFIKQIETTALPHHI